MTYTNTPIITSTTGIWSNTNGVSFSTIDTIPNIPYTAQLEVERLFGVDRDGSASAITDFLTDMDVKQADKRDVFLIPNNRLTINNNTKTITAIELPSTGNVYNYTYYKISDPTTPYTIKIPQIVDNSLLTIRRRTVSNIPLVTWIPGSKLTSSQLNLQTTQLLYLVQELFDRVLGITNTNYDLTFNLANNTVNTLQIVNGAVTPNKLAPNSSWSFTGTVSVPPPTADANATTRLYSLNRLFEHGVMTKDDSAPSSSAIDILETAPTAGASGLWFNPKSGQLKVWAGNAWVALVGTPVTAANLVSLDTEQILTAAKTFNQNTTIASTTASASTSTGALVVSGGVGIGGAAYIGGDVNMLSTGYLKIPSGAIGQRPGTPAAGMIRYSTTSNRLELYNGTAWESGLGVAPENILTITNATPSTNSNNGALVVTGGVGIGGAVNVSGAVNVGSNLSVQSGNITTASTGTALVFNTNATAVNMAGAATAITLGDATTATTTVRGGTLVGNIATQNLFNTIATTLNLGGAATTVSIGAATGTTTINNANTRVTGDLTLGPTRELRLSDSDSSHYIAFKSPATVATNNVYTLPDAIGSVGQVLSLASASSNNATLEWTTISSSPTAENLTLAGDLTVNGGDIISSATTFNLLNSVVNTLNLCDAATTITMGAATGTTTTIRGGTLVGNTSTQNLFNTTATTLNIGGAGTTVSIGAATGTTTINNANTAVTGDLAVNGGDITTTSTGTATVFNTNATTVNMAGAGTTVSIGAATGTTTINNANTVVTGDLAVNGGDITTTAAGTATVFNTNATTLNVGGAATTVTIGAGAGTTTTIRGGTLVGNTSTQNLFNTNALTVNAFGAANTVSIGAATGTTTINNKLTVQDSQQATSTTSGALKVTGGVGIQGAAYIGGILRATSTDASTAYNNGALIVTGGAGIGGAVNTFLDSKFNGVLVGRGSGDKPANSVVGDKALLNNTTGLYNTAIGYSAMEFSDNASFNTAVGADALNKQVTGQYNTGIGYQSLMKNVAGNNNTAIGVSALYNNLGNDNTAVGYVALFNNTEGIQNSAFGHQSLFNSTSGINNTAVGRAAMWHNTTGSNNVALGRHAGSYGANPSLLPVTAVDNSVLIGAMVRCSNNDNNTIVIGCEAISDGSNRTVIGNSSTLSTKVFGELRLSDSSTSTPNYVAFKSPATVATNNVYTLPAAVGSANQVLSISTVSGNNATLQWATPPSGTPGGENSYVQFNDSGTFGGDSGLTYNKTTDSLAIAGDLAVNGGDITTSAATFNLLNTTATTVNAFGAATTVAIGNTATAAQTVNMFTASTGASTYNFATGSVTTATTKTLNLGTGGAAASTTNVNIGSVQGGTTTVNSGTLAGGSATQAVFNTTATTVNAFGAATAITMGDSTTATTTIRGGTLVGNTTTQNLFNTTATTLNIGGAGTIVNIGAATGTTKINNALTVLAGDLRVNGGNIETQTLNSTFNLLNTTVTTLNIGGAATTTTIGYNSTDNSTTNISTGATTSSKTKTVNLGTGGAHSSTTNVNIGSSNGGTTKVNSPTLQGASATQEVFNTTQTVNAFGSAQTVSIGSAFGTTTINNANTVVAGDLAVNGGDITTTSTSAAVFNNNATALSIGGAATTVAIGVGGGTVYTPSIILSGDLWVGPSKKLFLKNSGSTTYIAFKSPATVANNNVYTLPDAVGLANQVLQIDSISGTDATLRWATSPSATPAGENTNVQFNQNGNFSGSNKFTYNGGTNTLAVGGYIIADNKGTFNGVAVWRGAGNTPTNTAVGSTALSNENATGANQTAVGVGAIGSGASTGQSNTAVGVNAMLNNTTGNDNTAVGMSALNSNTSGSSNVALGAAAGRYHSNGSDALTTASNSIYIGANCKGFNNNDSNTIVIGAGAIGTGPNQTVINTTSTTLTTIQGTTGSVLSVAGNTIRLMGQRTIASATTTGVKGDICHDNDYIYVCVETNQWKRVNISAW